MKYDIIYADPPWKYGGRSKNDIKRRPVEEYYPVMEFEQLKKLDVSNLANQDCLLFLWVVSPKLKECIEIAENWGFKYITVAFVWHKKRYLLGNYTMPSCELCLLFKRGKIPKGKLKKIGVKQFYEELSVRHSKKPKEIRNRIITMFPDSKRIELFARQKTEGWDVWGNEVKSDIKL